MKAYRVVKVAGPSGYGVREVMVVKATGVVDACHKAAAATGLSTDALNAFEVKS